MNENIISGLVLITVAYLIYVFAFKESDKADTSISDYNGSGVLKGMFLFPLIAIFGLLGVSLIVENSLPSETLDYLEGLLLIIGLFVAIIVSIITYRSNRKLKKMISAYNKDINKIRETYNYVLNSKQDIEKIEKFKKMFNLFNYSNLDFKNKETLSFKLAISNYKEGKLAFELERMKEFL